jgi:chitinase
MVSYDTKQLSVQKTDFIKSNHLGGAMWWESSGDKDGDKSLISTVSLVHQLIKIEALTSILGI